MKIKKLKKQMEQDIFDFIQTRITEFKEETEISVRSVLTDFGTSHTTSGEVEYHLLEVKTKLDI